MNNIEQMKQTVSKAERQGGEMNYKRILAKVALGLPLTKRENAVYELFIKK